MKNNAHTFEELKMLLEQRAGGKRIVTSLMLKELNIIHERITFNVLNKGGEKQELTIYVFPLSDGLYVCPTNRLVHFLDLSSFEKMSDRYLRLIVQKKKVLEEEQKALDGILLHPSQRLKTLYLDGKN